MPDKPILSILIPSIPERFTKWILLTQELVMQCTSLHETHPTLGRVEILSDTSDAFLNGGPSIGKKRESLVRKATGKYLCFLDDDENVSPGYVETLVRLCQLDTDVVTFRNLTKTDFYWTVVDMSLKNPVNEEATPERIVKRRPWHICPVRSEYAKRYEFSDANYGEDFDWMAKVLKHCETEAHTDAILHIYNHSAKTSESDKIIKAGYA
jgi:glycosyltransferase involved in cell wall biosynthesis